MRRIQSKLLSYTIIFLIVCIAVVIIVIVNNGKSNITIKEFAPGSLNDIGCLSLYIEDNDSNNEYSFDNGETWQRSKYGAIYGKTTVLVRNKEKNIIYKKTIKDEGFTSDAPQIKLNFDNYVNGKSDSELLKGVTASLNGKDISSKIKTNIVEEKNNEILVSYLVHSDVKRCYILKKTKVLKTSNNIGSNTTSISSNKWEWPTKSGYYISSSYGWRNKKFHSGVDIAGLKRGSPIYAAKAGVVTAITSNSSSGYYVTIKHDNGYYTRYAHMQNTKGNDKLGLTGSANKYVFVGLRVRAKDIIGEIGSSGNSTGPHLHFEIWNGKPFVSKSFNPLTFYKKK